MFSPLMSLEKVSKKIAPDRAYEHHWVKRCLKKARDTQSPLEPLSRLRNIKPEDSLPSSGSLKGRESEGGRTRMYNKVLETAENRTSDSLWKKKRRMKPELKSRSWNMVYTTQVPAWHLVYAAFRLSPRCDACESHVQRSHACAVETNEWEFWSTESGGHKLTWCTLQLKGQNKWVIT